MMRLTEQEMRLLCGIVLDARDTSHEAAYLADKIVKMTNEMYPVADNDENDAIFGTK